MKRRTSILTMLAACLPAWMLPKDSLAWINGWEADQTTRDKIRAGGFDHTCK